MSSNNYNILDLKEKIKQVSAKIKELVDQKKTEIEIEMFFFENDEKFYEEYPYLIKKLIKGGDMDFLEVMLNNLEKVESGEQGLAATELKLGEELANKYLYPNVKKDN